MWKRLLGAIIALGPIAPTQAGFLQLLGVGVPTVAAPSGYSGPGDVIPGAAAWWGLRGYNAAYATGSNPAADVCDLATGLTCSTINILSSGAFDKVTAAAATACSVACGVSKLYDQTGGGHDLTSAGDRTKMPTLTFNCIGSLPCMTYTGSQLLGSIGSVSFSQPWTGSFVGRRTAGFTSYNFIGPLQGEGLYFNNSANTVAIFCGSIPAGGAATDSSYHALLGICNGASSATGTDGTLTTVSAGTDVINRAYSLGSYASLSFPLQGNLMEGGQWTSAFSSGNASNMSSNQKTYWGF